MYERQNCPESDLHGLTMVESPICRICPQYMLGVRFVRARHLALAGPTSLEDYFLKRCTFGSKSGTKSCKNCPLAFEGLSYLA